MKQAYPNFSEYMPSSPTYNLSKWMGAMKDIYVKLHLGASKNQSVEEITKEWPVVEKREFLDWLRYYESGDHLKYKRAQTSYYVNDDINYFLPNPKGPIPSPIRSMNDQMANIPQEAAAEAANAANIAQRQNEISKEERRKLVEDQRRKILGRLNSAEKLLSSQHGQVFAGPDFERLLSAIYELKKQIQTVNKITLSSQTIVDLIVRQANILGKQGFSGASEFMAKFAQNTPGDFSLNLGEIPAGGSQPQGGALGNTAPDLAQPPGGPTEVKSEDITEDSAVGKFIANLEDSGLTDEEKKEDFNVAEDEVIINDDVDDGLMDQEIVPENDNELVVHAQAIDPEVKKPVAAPPLTPQEEAPAGNLEVESPAPGAVGPTGISPEEAKQVPNETPIKDDFDALIDSVFSNLSIADVVKKLEGINKIFRNREIGRQLAIVDVMLDHLGLAPYFPSLAEATNKQLEANQYCLTRIEDILSKLRGTMETAKIDLTNDNQKLTPEAEAARSSLEQGEAKDKQRKEVKKQIQEQESLEKAKPEAEVEGVQQELAGQPTQVEEAVPARPPVPAGR